MKTARVATKDSPTFAVADIIYNENRSRPGTLIYLKPTYFYETVSGRRSLIWHRQRRFSAREHDRPVVLGIAVRKLSPAWLLFDAQFMPAHTKPFADMAEFFKVVKHRAARLKADPEPAVAQTAGVTLVSLLRPDDCCDKAVRTPSESNR